MLKLLFFLFFVTLIAICSIWFIENDGSVTLVWLGYRIQTSVAFTILAAIVLVVLLTVILQIIILVMAIPTRIKKNSKIRKKERGLTALADGFAAVAAGETGNAKRLTRKAEANLGETPITKLLLAQTAQSEGNKEQAKIHYTAMLGDKKTEMIAIKGLLLQAREDGDLNKAIFLAEKASKIKPDATWPLSILVDLYKRNSNWNKATESINKARKKNIIDNETAKRDLAIIELAKSSASNTNDALKLASKSYKELPYFSPAAENYCHMLIANNQNKKATKIIETAWKTCPSPELSKLYVVLHDKESDEKKLNALEKLNKVNSNTPFANIEIAKTAIKLNMPSKARNHLKMALAFGETRKICDLMAEVETLDNADSELIYSWQSRATSAPKDSNFICTSCGFNAEQWTANCPNCKSFDSIKFYYGSKTSAPHNELATTPTIKAIN